MNGPIQLFQLACVHCGTPLTADEAEVVWQCAQCQKGTRLADDGLAPVAVHWAAGQPGSPSLRWLPFWIFTATVRFTDRQTYRGDNKPDSLWAAPRRFYIPAYTVDLQQLEAIGSTLLRAQPVLEAGTIAGSLTGCTCSPEEAVAAAEFVVITVEADRNDMLRTIGFSLETSSAPDLWLLPFDGTQLRVRSR